MNFIKITNLTLDYPILGTTNGRSFKKKLINVATGGKICLDKNENPTVRALSNISINIEPGDRVGLFGHNGSGKTTLLKAILGIYKPNLGEIKVNGTIASMISMTLGMDYDSSGYDNIYLRGMLLGIRKNEIDKLVPKIIDFSGLGDYINLPMRTYSSGMQMRLAFSVAMSIRGDIVLMDEWVSVGDKEFTLLAEQKLTEYIKNSKI